MSNQFPPVPTSSRNWYRTGSLPLKGEPVGTGTGALGENWEPVNDPMIDQPDLFNLAIQAEPKRTRRVHPAKHLESMAGRGLRATWCPFCHTPTLTGIDNDTCAFPARVDITPLDTVGELLAVLATPPRWTYSLTQPGGQFARITRRTSATIKSRPAGGRNSWHVWDVVPEHRCHQPLPAITSRLTRITEKKIIDERCPF